MVSGNAPIRARKIRYYTDANFKARALPPPPLVARRYADAPPQRGDDWSALSLLSPACATTASAMPSVATADDGGPRQQPELTEVAYTPQPERLSDDLALLDDDDDLPLPLPTQFDPRLQRVARLAALDPDDGITL